MNNLKLMPLIKNNSKLIFALFLTVTTFSLPLTPNAIAQENSESSIQSSENEQKLEPTINARNREQSSILEAIWKLLKAKREQEPPLSSRSNLCEITPGLLGEINVIYSDRPLFLWQGRASNLEINLYSPFSADADQELLWTQTVNGESQNVLYTGEALQPGQTYDWEIVTDSQAKRRPISFKVKDGEERDRISGELTQLETKLTTSGATNEEIVLAKANYFAERDLWSDTLQQLFSLEQFSTVVKDNNQKIVSYLCQSDNL